MNLDKVLNTVVVIGIILSGLGYAVGQFMSQRRKGQSDALATALQEIAALKIKSERQDADAVAMQSRMSALETENTSFRKIISDALRQATP